VVITKIKPFLDPLANLSQASAADPAHFPEQRGSDYPSLYIDGDAKSVVRGLRPSQIVPQNSVQLGSEI
jgi:hypothetical protein